MNIFININGTRRGPYSPEELKQLIGRGEIALSACAWYKGRSEWTKLSEIQELLNVLLPPLPKGERASQTQVELPSIPVSKPSSSALGPAKTPVSANNPPAPLQKLGETQGFWPKDGDTWWIAGIIGIPGLMACVGTGLVLGNKDLPGLLIGGAALVAVLECARRWIVAQLKPRAVAYGMAVRTIGMGHIVLGVFFAFLAIVTWPFLPSYVSFIVSVSLFALGFRTFQYGRQCMRDKRVP